MNKQKLFSILGSLSLCLTEAAYCQISENPPTTQIEPSSQMDLMTKKLSIISTNYLTTPETPLSNQDIKDLEDYANHSLETSYKNLSKADVATLSQIINLNAVRLNPSTVTKFNTDRKLAARFNNQDIKALNAIVIDIRDGKALSPDQVNSVKDFETFISQSPSAFIDVLPFLTEYVSLNTNQFTPSDLLVFRQAIREASGISTDQAALLEAIAKRNNNVLNLEDTKAFQDLMRKAPLGALDGFEPAVIVSLNQNLMANKTEFPPQAIANFNANFNKNQAIRQHIEPNKSSRPKVQKTTPKTPQTLHSSAGER